MSVEALAQLAAAGSGALVGAMATDVWEQVRARVVALFGRGDASREQMVRFRLDEAFVRLRTAAPGMREIIASELRAEWRGSLRTLLVEHPDVIENLRALVSEMGVPASGAGSVIQHATADRGGVVNQAGRNLYLYRDRRE